MTSTQHHFKHAIERKKNKCWNSLNVLKGMQLLMIWMLKWSNGQTVYHFYGIYFSLFLIFSLASSKWKWTKGKKSFCRFHWTGKSPLDFFFDFECWKCREFSQFLFMIFIDVINSFECDFLVFCFFLFISEEKTRIYYIREIFQFIHYEKRLPISPSPAIELPDTIKYMKWSPINAWNGAQRHAYHSMFFAQQIKFKKILKPHTMDTENWGLGEFEELKTY